MAKVRITKRTTFQTLIEQANKRGKIPAYSHQSRHWYRERAMRLRNLPEGDTQRILRRKSTNDNEDERLFNMDHTNFCNCFTRNIRM